MGVQDHDGWENHRDVPAEALDIDARELVDNDDEVDATTFFSFRVRTQGLARHGAPGTER